MGNETVTLTTIASKGYMLNFYFSGTATFNVQTGSNPKTKDTKTKKLNIVIFN